MLKLPETAEVIENVEKQLLQNQASFEAYKISEAQKNIKRLDQYQTFTLEMLHNDVKEIKGLLDDLLELEKANVSHKQLVKETSVG